MRRAIRILCERPWHAVLLGLAALWLGAGLYHFAETWRGNLRSIGIERFYMERVIAANERDYLAGMRDTHLGCETVLYRSPDVIFFGDSHSYAGWDFGSLAEELPVRVGVCALSGAFPENLMDLFAAIERTDLAPRTVVVGLSPRMTWDVEERPDRIARAAAHIADIGRPREDLVALLSGDWRAIEPFVGASVGQETSIERIDAATRELDPDAFDRLLRKNQDRLYATRWWRDYAAGGRQIAGIEETIAAVSARAHALGIAMLAVYLPESRWLNALYSDDQRAAFIGAAEAFARHGHTVDLRFFDARGQPNIHHLNRYMLADYPYAALDSIEAIERWIAENEPERRWQIFDPDHMNPVGARIFTREMIPVIRELMTRAEPRS